MLIYDRDYYLGSVDGGYTNYPETAYHLEPAPVRADRVAHVGLVEAGSKVLRI